MEFEEIVSSVRQILESENDGSDIAARVAGHGYGTPQNGSRGHITFTKTGDVLDQLLIDVPGGEWHHMTAGVVNRIGELSDSSLEEYLN